MSTTRIVRAGIVAALTALAVTVSIAAPASAASPSTHSCMSSTMSLGVPTKTRPPKPAAMRAKANTPAEAREGA